MLRFICREVYVGHVVHAQGQPEVTWETFDAINLPELEGWLRYKDQPNGTRPDYLTRECVGVEVIPIEVDNE